MSLLNMDNSNGYLEAVGDGAEAVSVQKVQAIEEKDFQVVRDISMDLEFGNIADTFTYVLATSIMTGYTTPDGIITGSGNNSIYGQEWMVFDGTLSDRWYVGTNDTSDEWVNYELPTPAIVDKYIMYADTRAINDNFPPAWEIQGSNDGINYTTLDIQSGQVLQNGASKEYVIANPDSYLHYRWWKVNAGKTYIELGQIEYMTKVGGTPDVLETTHTIANGDKLVIVRDDYSIHEIVASNINVIPLTYAQFIPVMTSNNTPSGVVSSSGESSTTYADWKATLDATNYGWISNTASTVFWQYETAEPILLEKFAFTASQAVAVEDHPQEWNLLGSNDGVNFTLIQSYTNDGSLDTVNLKEYPITNPTTAYKFHKLEFVNVANRVGIRWVRFYKIETSMQELNTSAITFSEIPSRVYKLDAGVEFNNKPAKNPIDTLTFDATLKSTRTYDEASVKGRTLETKVKLSKGNKMIGLNANVYRKA